MESHSRHPSKRGAMADAEMEDRLSGLPGDLLHSILRRLPLKHAARTSALSRRWARQWLRALVSSPVLDFTDRDFARRQPPERAAATVGRCLRLHAEHGAPLDAFRVALVAPTGLGDDALGRDVLGWLAAAVGRGAREVEVDLTATPASAALVDSGTTFLDLPADLFLASNSLERLALGRCSLRAVPPAAAGLAGLRSLSLSHTDVTGEAVRGLLANCRALESLSLQSCHLLTSLRIAGERLRVLELVRCPAVRELLVSAPALESFAFYGDIVYSSNDANDTDGDGDDGLAPPPAVDLGATPALRDAYLSHLGFRDGDDRPHPYDLHYAYSDFLRCIEHAPVLTICSVGFLLGYNESMTFDMENTLELQLLMAPLEEDDDVDFVCRFFHHTAQFPLLDRLFVRLPGGPAGAGGAVTAAAEAAAAGEIDDPGMLFFSDGYVLDHLRFIKVVNFRGSRGELQLLVFFLKRAPVLEEVVLVTPEGEGAPGGDEWLAIMQGRVSAMPKASPAARVTVCRPSDDRSQNPAHTRFYHEEGDGVLC
ncbi:hypothetical protein ACP4OV_021156 [Aristida adscensionis]